MSSHSLPFFDSAEEATKHAIAASGKTIKQVAAALWPDKSADAARTALSNALNENRDERLTADQHLFVANFCGEYDWLYYIAHKCNHSRPSPVSPEVQAAEFQAALFAKADELRDVLKQIDALKPRLVRAA